MSEQHEDQGVERLRRTLGIPEQDHPRTMVGPHGQRQVLGDPDEVLIAAAEAELRQEMEMLAREGYDYSGQSVWREFMRSMGRSK